MCAFGCGVAVGCYCALTIKVRYNSSSDNGVRVSSPSNNFIRVSGDSVSTIAVGDKVYTGRYIELNQNGVTVDGEKYTPGIEVQDVYVTGNPDRIETVGYVSVAVDVNSINTTGNVDVSGTCGGNIDTRGSVSVVGDCKNISSVGNVHVRGNSGSIKTTGNVTTGSCSRY